MKPLFLLVFLLLAPLAALSQNAKIDSLKRVIETTQVDSVRGRSLCLLCEELKKVGHYELGLSSGERGAEISRKVKDWKSEAGCLNNIGNIYDLQGDNSRALDYYQRSLKVVEKIGDQVGKAACLNNIGIIYYNQGDYPRAHDYYQRSLKIYEEIGDRGGVADILNNIGSIYRNQGDYPRALEYYQRTLKVFEENSDRAGEAGCLNSFGIIYGTQGDYRRALDYFQRSLKIREEIDDREGVASSLSNIGILYSNQGNYPRAIEFYQSSLKIEEELGDRVGVAICLNNIGNVYLSQDDYPHALENYQRSLKIEEESGNRAGVASSLNDIGNIYLSQGDYPRALEYYKRSLKIQEEIVDRVGIANSLNNIGSIYNKQGDYPRALDYYQRGLKIREEIGNRAGVANSLCNISSIYIELGQLQTARVHALRGLKTAQEVGHLQFKQQGAQVLYRADSALGNWKSAFEGARLYHIYSDSIKNDEQSKELGRLESKAEYDKQAEIDKLKNEEEKKRERERNSWILGSAGGGLLLLLIVAFTLYRGRLKEKKANTALRSLNEEIQQQKGEIEAQNTEINTINTELQSTLDEVNKQRQTLEEQHLKIEDSIRYASRIQTAIMPAPEQLIESLPPHFIHYQPRDIVSGDFYWMTQLNGKTFFAAVDCTGHGVPGAFMSVLGSNLLHQIVDENQITEPDVILSELDRRIAATLRQQFGGDSKDGMDVALIVLHEAEANGKRVVEFAGAGRPLWRYAQGQITEYKSAKYSCGGSQHEDKTYPAHRIEAQAGDRLYIFSDGPVDQFGGPHGRKLGSTQLQRFLAETAASSIEEQGKQFDLYFNDWMKSKKQLDDVLLAGVAL